MKIKSIAGTITLDDGRTHEFRIDDTGYLQWGAPNPQLGETVYALSDMQRALGEGGYLDDDDDDESEIALECAAVTLDNHSFDIVRLFYGSEVPIVLCGYHRQALSYARLRELGLIA